MSLLRKIWHFVRWPLLVLALAYIAFVIYFIPIGRDKYLTEQAVAHIYAQKITLSDVMGTNLPPQPYEPENDATVAGIDKNNNGIRDDVELAIFAKYPNSAKIRAAELQYALDEQILITEVTNSETWVAQAQEDGRGYLCVGDSIPNSVDIKTANEILNSRISEVNNLVFNTQARKDAKEKADSFITSFGDLRGDDCDIDLNSLPN